MKRSELCGHSRLTLLLQFHYHPCKKYGPEFQVLTFLVKSCLVCMKLQDAAQHVVDSVPEQH